MLLPAKLKNEALLADIQAVKIEKESFHLWWLGQSGFLIQWQGRHLLIDPYLSDSLTIKYAATDKPHIRMSELVIEPAQLDFIDVITSSHNHTDHLDGDTLIPLWQCNPDMKLIIPEANREFVCHRLKCPVDWPIGLNDGDSIECSGFTFNGIQAAHNEMERNESGQCHFMGYVIQFGPWTVYHSGDTLWRDEIIEALAPFSIDLALLPINGNKPERRVAGNLNAEEAVRMAKTIGAAMVIPCHYDMFTFNTGDPQIFVKEAQLQNQAYCVLRGGERWTSKQV